MTACYECKTFSTIDKMGEEFWDSWAPGGGLASQDPGLTTFQVSQDKINSINRKPELQFAHRLMALLVCGLGFTSSNPKLQSLESHPSPMKRTCSLGPFPNWDSRCAVTRDFRKLFKSGCWEKKKNPIWWCILCSLFFSFLLILSYWKQAK